MNTANTLKRYLAIAAIAAGATLSTPAAAVPVLLGNATLNSADDLTVIQDGGQVLQFLDFSATQGASVANSLATYGASGFRWATGVEVAQLYAAFGFTYQSIATTFAILNVPAANAASFTSYLGTTAGDAALGWIDDNTTASFHTYACISVTRCTPNAFVENTRSFWPEFASIAVYLVRDQPNNVPEPGTLMLFGLGILGAMSMRGKRTGVCNASTR